MLFKNREEIVNNGETLELKKVRGDILDILSYAVKAVDPYEAVKKRFKNECILVDDEKFFLNDFRDVYSVGFGKASFGMMKAVCDSVPIKKGVAVSNSRKNMVKRKNVKCFIGGHPLPNERSVKGTEAVVKTVEKCGEDDLLIVLISGGGSALLCKPRVSLGDLQITTQMLLESGADINEINTIRKHLSLVKGGQLLKNVKCMVVSFIISDIVGDPLEFIASGPTYPDSTTFKDARDVLERYGLLKRVPLRVKEVIARGLKGGIPETPKQGDPVFDNVHNFIVANNDIAVNAAKDEAEKLGYQTRVFTTSLTGEAREKGVFLLNKVKNYDISGKTVFISGGETTVTIRGNGHGGRNQEMVLANVEGLSSGDIVFSSFATDGVDGKSDAAGAIADGFTLKRARKQGLDPNVFLRENDSYTFFKKLNDCFITGSTGTNVMDVQIIAKI